MFVMYGESMLSKNYDGYFYEDDELIYDTWLEKQLEEEHEDMS